MAERPAFPLGWAGHNGAHHPIFRDQTIEAIPYLTLPFQETDQYQIQEGWKYSPTETRIHGSIGHAALDFGRPYGSKVLAPAAGIIMASYFSYLVRAKDSDVVKVLQGKEVGMGLGLFVQLYVPSTDRHIVLAHLSRLYDHIPYSSPQRRDHNTWYPTNHAIRPEEADNHPDVFKRVEAGEPIGEVGFSGLTWGYEDIPEGENRPQVHDPEKISSWDQPHIHMEECRRDDNGVKQFHRDPYDIYNTHQFYPTPTMMRAVGREPLFILGPDGLPIYAR